MNPVKEPFSPTLIEDISTLSSLNERVLFARILPIPSVRMPSTVTTSVLSISPGCIDYYLRCLGDIELYEI